MDCALCRTFQRPLGAFQFSRYNGGRNGGAANDENRGHQGIFQEGSFARRHRRAAVLHFQIRLHQEWRAGSSLALDTLRPALRHPSDVRLDRAGRRRRAVRAELHHRRPHRGLRTGVAPAGGGMVCAPYHLPPDRGILNRNNDRGKPAGQSQPAFLIIPILHHGKSPALTSISGLPASGSLPASSWPPAGGSRRPPGPCR